MIILLSIVCGAALIFLLLLLTWPELDPIGERVAIPTAAEVAATHRRLSIDADGHCGDPKCGCHQPGAPVHLPNDWEAL